MFEKELVLSLFDTNNKEKSNIMIDVGAHVGSSAIPFLINNWEVYCFEPDPTNFSELSTNLKEFPKSHLFNCGISNEEKPQVDFYISNKHWGIHSLMPFDQTHQKKISINVISLNKFLKNKNLDHVDFIKIDTEGADFLVIKGIGLNSVQPRIIMAEFMDERTIPHFKYSLSDMVQYLTGYNYSSFVFEYSKIIEYGIKGKRTQESKFLKAYKYNSSQNPSWGNVLFIHNDYLQEFKRNFFVKNLLFKITNIIH